LSALSGIALCRLTPSLLGVLLRPLFPFEPDSADRAAQIKVGCVGVIVFRSELRDQPFRRIEEGRVVHGEDGGVECWRGRREGGKGDGVVVDSGIHQETSGRREQGERVPRARTHLESYSPSPKRSHRPVATSNDDISVL
jgi:hypothetical protein